MGASAPTLIHDETARSEQLDNLSDCTHVALHFGVVLATLITQHVHATNQT